MNTTANQLKSQRSPDGGYTQVWYDIMGREVLSKTQFKDPIKFAYTFYDNLNRIVEFGEIDLSDNYLFNDMAMYSGGELIYHVSEKITRRPEVLVDLFGISDQKRTQITKTFYDTEFTDNSVNSQFIEGQQNLRSRVSGTTIDYDGDGNYEYGTFHTIHTEM